MSVDPDDARILPIAYKYANRYRMVERSDIAQELYVWWLSHPRVVARFTEEEKDRRLEKALSRAAERYCRKEKAAHAGYSVWDEAFYDTTMVRELLPMVFNPELITQDTVAEEGGVSRRSKPANEGNNLVAMVSDVSRGLETMEIGQQELLELAFAERLTFEELATVYDVSVNAAKMRLQRTLEQLVMALGGPSPWDGGLGTKQVQSNAAALARTGSEYNG